MTGTQFEYRNRIRFKLHRYLIIIASSYSKMFNHLFRLEYGLFASLKVRKRSNFWCLVGVIMCMQIFFVDCKYFIIRFFFKFGCSCAVLYKYFVRFLVACFLSVFFYWSYSLFLLPDFKFSEKRVCCLSSIAQSVFFTLMSNTQRSK